MDLRNVGNRVAVNLDSLNLRISNEEALKILERKRIKCVKTDIFELAKNLVGVAQWRWGSKQWEAPYYFDCSALTKWLYGQMGIWLPRRGEQQFEYCEKHGSIVNLDNYKRGDLLFLSSHFKNGVLIDFDDGIGHVCMVVEKNRAICSSNSELGQGVVNLLFDDIFATRKLRAIGRVCDFCSLITLLVPPDREIESSDDIKHIILRSC